jgi:hypothetical protein
MPRSGIASRMESCPPDGFNQPSVTTRLKETPENRAIRVNSEVKSKRGSTSDLERALVFEQYERAQNNRGTGSLKKVKKAEPRITLKLAMSELSYSSYKCFYRDYKKWKRDKKGTTSLQRGRKAVVTDSQLK